MSYKRLIGVMIPTRKRVKLLQECLDSFNAKTKDKTLVELLLKVDIDDKETQYFLNTYKSDIDIKVIVSDRKNGYGSLHEHYNLLAEVSVSEFLIVFNDDIEMLTDSWEQQYLPYKGKDFVLALKNKRIKNGKEYSIFEGYNGNPAIPCDFYKKFGTLSYHPMLDDWWVTITNTLKANNFNIEKWVDVTVLFKRPDGEYTDLSADETYLEGRQHINWNHHHSPELRNYINNLIDYINDNPEKFI